MTTRQLIIGIGNNHRGDDAAGLEVIRQLKQRPPAGWNLIATDGEPAKLMDSWEAYDHVIAVDAVTTGANASGTIYTWDVTHDSLPSEFRYTSSHALGLSDAIELARALGRLPKRIEIIGIEANNFDFCETISDPVQKAIENVVQHLTLSLEPITHA